MAELLPVWVVLSSLVPGLVIFFLGERQHRARMVLNLTAASVKLLLVAWLLVSVRGGAQYTVAWTVLPTLTFKLEAAPLSLLFVSLSAVLWLVTTVYALGYLEASPQRSRFFGFFSLCVSATAGVALSGNLVTFLVFYELLTLATYPLVVHRGTEAALAAGRKYLAYTLSGSAIVLVAVVWLHSVHGSGDFRTGGILGEADIAASTLRAIFALLIAGLGVKAALVPLHGWLPSAMVAPAPVSALLHAVAVVKAGAFGIIRVVYDVYGIDVAEKLGVTGPLAVAAAITIVYGSLRAVFQDDLKRRLAYSTVSQVSYIALGTAVIGPIASIGGIVHLVHQGLMKITLFLCAGNLAETRDIGKISQMQGVGKLMPWTMAAFTVAALGMIGIPPMAGFISKWYLGLGAVEAGQYWALAVLMVSSVLNAIYFLPIIYKAWFELPESESQARGEAPAMLLVPALVTAALALLVGVAAGAPLSPLSWTMRVAGLEHGL